MEPTSARRGGAVVYAANLVTSLILQVKPAAGASLRELASSTAFCFGCRELTEARPVPIWVAPSLLSKATVMT